MENNFTKREDGQYRVVSNNIGLRVSMPTTFVTWVAQASDHYLADTAIPTAGLAAMGVAASSYVLTRKDRKEHGKSLGIIGEGSQYAVLLGVAASVLVGFTSAMNPEIQSLAQLTETFYKSTWYASLLGNISHVFNVEEIIKNLYNSAKEIIKQSLVSK